MEIQIEIRIDETSEPVEVVDDERQPWGVVPVSITNAFESARASYYPIGTLTTVLNPDGTLRQTIEAAPDLKRFNNGN